MARKLPPGEIRLGVRTSVGELSWSGRPGFDRIDLVRGEASRRRIEALKRPAGQPQQSDRILDHCSDTLRRRAGCSGLPGAEPASCRILKAVKAISRSGPEGTLVVHHQAEDDVVAQAMGIGGVMAEGGEPPRPGIVTVQPAVCAEPQVSGAIFDDRDT